MTVTLRDASGHRADRRWIESVYRDYLDDLAPDATGVFPSLNEIGFCEPDQLAQWFADESASVLTLLSQQQPVGFAMVAMARGGLAAGTVTVPARNFKLNVYTLLVVVVVQIIVSFRFVT